MMRNQLTAIPEKIRYQHVRCKRHNKQSEEGWIVGECGDTTVWQVDNTSNLSQQMSMNVFLKTAWSQSIHTMRIEDGVVKQMEFS